MIEVRGKTLKEYFKVSDIVFAAGGIPWRVKYRYWLHPLLFLIALGFVLVLFSLANSFYFFLSLSLLAYLILTFLQTKRSAEWVEITRQVSKAVKHRGKLKVTLTIKNKSRLRINDLVIKDSFTVSSEGQKTLWLGYELRPREKIRIEYEITADGGIGKQSFGPLQAIIADPLGLFEFRRIDHDLETVEVIPVPNPKLAQMTPQSLFTDGLGNQESPRPGDSVSFYELRNYVPGDSLKRISWKLSTKYQKLLVKEFEDLVSEDFTLYLDFDQSRHFGFWGQNTWNSVKETAISILLHSSKNRRFQVLSQNLFVPFGGGISHGVLAANQIRDLKPTAGESRTQLSAKLQNMLPFGSSLLYIGPTYVEEPSDLIETFRMVRQLGVQICVVLIDTGSFAAARDRQEFEALLAGHRNKAALALKEMSSSLASIEVPFAILEAKDFVS
jgi:uncharacterized protein (DUF58 family)